MAIKTTRIKVARIMTPMIWPNDDDFEKDEEIVRLEVMARFAVVLDVKVDAAT